jgi:cytochrome c553
MPTGVTAEDKRQALASITAGQCVACHLSGFEGNSRVPRARGQHLAYLEKTLLDFKTKARNNSPSKSSLMATMSEDEIASMAAYLAGMEIP